jgi:hypothetical protein
MRLNGKGVAPGQTDLMDLLGGNVAHGRKAALQALRVVLVDLVQAVDALHASDEVVRALVKAGVNVRLALAIANAARCLDETEHVA